MAKRHNQITFLKEVESVKQDLLDTYSKVDDQVLHAAIYGALYILKLRMGPSKDVKNDDE